MIVKFNYYVHVLAHTVLVRPSVPVMADHAHICDVYYCIWTAVDEDRQSNGGTGSTPVEQEVLG